MTASIQVLLKPHIIDVKGKKVEEKCLKQLGITTGKVKSSKLFSVNYAASEAQLQDYAIRCIKDVVTDEILVNELYEPTNYQVCIAIAQLPGVTDDEGTSAQMAWVDFFNVEADVNTQHIFTQEVYYFENKLSQEELTQIAKRLLGNPLINHFSYAYQNEAGKVSFTPYVPEVKMAADDTTETVNLQ